MVPLYVTHVEAIGRFLKIYGQTNQNEGIAIEAAIRDVVEEWQKKIQDNDSHRLTENNIKVGTMCLSKYTDGLYYRCKVIDHEAMDNVLVHFIDYGNDEIISMKDMIALSLLTGPKVDFLLRVGAQAKEYVLAAYWNTNWTEQSLTEIRNAIVNEVVQAECFSSVRDCIFINIGLAEHQIPDLSAYLIEQKGIGQVIDLRSQRELLMLVIDGLETKDMNMGQVAYTSNTLNMHSKYEVVCSHVQDGPFLFSVQLKSELPELENMMAELQKLRLQEFPTDILIGMACLVRTDRVYRGLITQMAHTSVVVCMVDYGHSQTVSYHHVYDIPAKYSKRKIFAVRSTMANYKKLDRYNKDLKERFSQLVANNVSLIINVAPLEGSPSVHYCQVLLANGDSVYEEMLKVQTKFLDLAENEPIPNGFVGPVKITWLHNPGRFFIRLLLKQHDYEQLSVKLNEFFECNTHRPALTEIRIGAFCALKANGQWCRAEIMDIKKTEEGQRTVIVNLIDVGRDIEVGLSNLKRLNYDICQIPRLALECALHNVNTEENPKTVAQFARAINLQKYPDRVYVIKSLTRLTYISYLVDLMDEEQNVIINKCLQEDGPLNLDKYYMKCATNGHEMSKTASNGDLNYVMPLGQFVNVIVVNWVSADEFYVHLKDQKKSFSEFIKSLQGIPKTLAVGRVPNGQIVLAVYSLTGLYYRAEIFDYNEQLRKYKVFFSDIGIRAIVSADQVYLNPLSFTAVPKFSHSCCLVDREKLPGNKSPDAEKRISAIVQNAEEVKCVVKERIKGDVNVITVTIDGMDLLARAWEENGVDFKGRSTEMSTANLILNNGTSPGLKENDDNQLDPEILKNQTLWIKPVDFLSKDVFRFSIKDIKGDLHKGTHPQGAVHLGNYMAMEVTKIDNQIFNLRTVKAEIIPQPILGATFSVTVCQPPTNVLNKLAVQKISTLAQFTRVLMEMKKYYATVKTIVPMEILRQCENQLFAIESKDEFWYRAELLKVTEADELIFDLFDYGRQEKVDRSKIRHLDIKFRNFNKMATEVYLPIEQFTEKLGPNVIMEEIEQLTKNISVILKVIENYRGRWIVDIVSNGFSISQALKEKKLAIACTMARVRKQIDRELEEIKPDEDSAEQRKLEAVEIGHFDSPDRIFVQLKSELPFLKQMQETLQIVAPSLNSVGALRVDEMCIAQNSFDNQWYRAKILDSAPDMTSVQFIDYGNTDVITSDKGAKLKKMIEEFANIPEYAKFCALPMRPVGDRRTEWDDDAFSVFSHYLEKPDKECEFLTETKLRRYFIRLFVQGDDMENVLKSRGLGTSVELIRSNSVCFVSHINALSEFYIQLDRDATVLDLLHDYFRNVNSLLPVTEPKEGEVYAAQFLDDMEWYRAKLMKGKSSDGGWDVLFIDYGNVANVKSLKELASKEIRDIGPLSKKCKLYLPKNVLTVSVEAEMRFEEIAQSGATLMTVNLVSLERDSSIVELVVLETGKNLLELLPLKRNPYENDNEFDS